MIIALAKSGNDAGIDSETGTYINGGTVFGIGDMLLKFLYHLLSPPVPTVISAVLNPLLSVRIDDILLLINKGLADITDR